MISTADKILAQWQGWKIKGGQYRGSCPFVSSSDGESFSLKIEDGEHGAWSYFASKNASEESGSLYELADKMQIPRPDKRIEVQSTKTTIDGLEDYAKGHYTDVQFFIDVQWQAETIYNRPALTWQTQSGKRARYIDAKGGFTWVGENKGNCWYMLEKAIKCAYADSIPIVLCNGEASTVAGQAHGIPAFCGTGGEGAISDDMLSKLNNLWKGQIYIALDCDDKGKVASDKVQKLLPDAIIIDLGLSDKGDLADFCGLHTNHNPMKALQNIVTSERKEQTQEIIEHIEFVSSHDLLSQFIEFVTESPELFGRVIKMPFTSLRRSGGFANMMTTKKVWLIGNVSGGGKTILSESLCDAWNKMGHNTVYMGDEWTPMESIARCVQRNYQGQNAVDYMQFLEYAEAKGKLEFSQSQTLEMAMTSRYIRSWKGKNYVMKTNSKVAFLEDIMDSLSRKIEAIRADGKEIDVVVLDYLSLYDTKAQSNNVEEYKVGLFKSYCKTLDVLGVSTVQVNQSASDRVVKSGGFLTALDLYYIRPDKGNLISTMNRVLRSDPATDKPYLDLNGQPEPTSNIAIVTAKNSVASPQEYAYFHFDFKRMRICEGLHPDYHYRDGRVLIRDTADLSSLGA